MRSIAHQGDTRSGFPVEVLGWVIPQGPRFEGAFQGFDQVLNSSRVTSKVVWVEHEGLDGFAVFQIDRTVVAQILGAIEPKVDSIFTIALPLVPDCRVTALNDNWTQSGLFLQGVVIGIAWRDFAHKEKLSRVLRFHGSDLHGFLVPKSTRELH